MTMTMGPAVNEKKIKGARNIVEIRRRRWHNKVHGDKRQFGKLILLDDGNDKRPKEMNLLESLDDEPLPKAGDVI